MNCRNCSHPQTEHDAGSGRCGHSTSTAVERTECTCPAYNRRPRLPQMTTDERRRVLQARVNDLERTIGALTTQREQNLRELRELS
jgi:hypothetical protein